MQHNKKCKKLIVFDDLIADMRKSYFAVPKKYQVKFYAIFYYKSSK